MSSTDQPKQAEQIVSDMYAALDGQFIARRIDGPVDRGLQTFPYEAANPVNHENFHRIIADFTEHLYATVLRAPWKISCRAPLAQALYLLENHYQGTYFPGYMGAWLDAIDPQQDRMDTVLPRMAEAVKAMERQEYIHWAFVAHYESLPWELRCRVADIWLEQYRPFLPPALQHCSASELIKVIPSLMQTFMGTDGSLQEISQSSP
ncbi:MAG: hypothetical protein GY869_04630 [Planctomycetes bacterium]|nr:hypothetical protein [Planctomycetota bacterium]